MFCFEAFKHSSSCIPKCNSFYLIFWGGVMSFLIISLRVSWFTSYQEWGILNPLISSLELSWYRFHLKPSLRNVVLWCLSMIQVFSYPLGESSFHLFIDLKQSIVSVSGRLSPHHFEMFAISPQQACAFRCWFSNNSVQFFFARMLSKLICGRSWHFLLHSVIPMIYLLFFLPEALWCFSFHSSSRIGRIMFFSRLSI